MNYKIREIRKEEYPLLADFLYEAIFIPEGVSEPPREILNQSELQVYIEDFGKKDDNCLVAENEGKVVGAVWTRIMDDYGHIDDRTPSFAISLYKEYRGYGIGTVLMQEMIKRLQIKGYQKASLSVQKANYAYKLYQKVGFQVVGENEEEYIMSIDLAKHTEIQYELLTEEKIDEVLNFWSKLDGVHLHSNGEETFEGIQKYLKRNTGGSFLALKDGEIVGAILSGHDGRRGFINHLGVQLEYRRMGIASKLLSMVETYFSEQGIKKEALFVLQDNKLAQSFYESIGWKEETIIKTYCKKVEDKMK